MGCDALSAQVGGDVVRHLGLVADWLKLDPAYGFTISASSDRQVELLSLAPGPKVSPCPHIAVVVAVGHGLGLLDGIAEETCGVGVEIKPAQRRPVVRSPAVEHERPIDSDQRRLQGPPYRLWSARPR